MQTKQIALLIFLIGLFLLFVLSENLEAKKLKISDMSRKNLGEKISIQGKIQDIIQKQDLTILTINDSTGILDGIIYEPISLEKNIIYSFEGKIKEYNQELELEIEKIREV